MERLLRRYVQLHWAAAWVLSIGFGGGLIWIFASGHESAWFAYPIYAGSFYILVVDCAALGPRLAAWIKRRKKAAEAMDPAAKARRLKLQLLRHLAVNLVYGLGQMIQGVLAGSAWLGGNGLYNLCLGVVYGVLLACGRRLGRCEAPQSRQRLAWRCYTVCGFLLSGVNLTMTGLAIQMIWLGRSGSYSETAVIAAAAFTFYKLTMAVIRVCRVRSSNAPFLGAVRNLGLTEGLMSLFSLQTALLAVFGSDLELQFLLNHLTGFAVCVMTMLCGVGMAWHGRKRIRQLRREEHRGTERIF